MQISRSLLNGIACSLLLSTFCGSMTAVDNVLQLPAVKQYMQIPSAKTAILAGLVASWFKLYFRNPVSEKRWDADATNSYNLKALLDVKKIGTKEYWNNVYSVYNNGFVGQCYKSKSHKLGHHDEDRIQLHSEDCLPHGVCGNIDAGIKILSKSTEGLAGLLLTYSLLNHHGFTGIMNHKLQTASKDCPAETKPSLS